MSEYINQLQYTRSKNKAIIEMCALALKPLLPSVYGTSKHGEKIIKDIDEYNTYAEYANVILKCSIDIFENNRMHFNLNIMLKLAEAVAWINTDDEIKNDIDCIEWN